MNRNEVIKYCLSKAGVEERVHGDPSNIQVYAVGNKKFAYFKTSDPEKWRFSIRVSPERFLELTAQPGIKPARYMGRFHWVSIVKLSNMPNEYLKELIDWSYQKAFNSLTKKVQADITTDENA